METVNLKGADELHIKDVGVFFIKDRKAYYADGRPVKSDDLRVCQHCQNSPPFVAAKEIDFAKHMVEKHPEYANGKTPEAKRATEATKAAEKAKAALKVAAKKAAAEKAAAEKAKAELLSLDQMTKKELLAVAEEEGLDVDKRLKKAELLAEIRAKMPLSNNPNYI